MSLDVSLIGKEIDVECSHCYISHKEKEDLFSSNITHNLTAMADACGIYYVLWKPEEIQCTFAKDIIPILEEGLKKLKRAPVKYSKYNASNGWGMYEHFVPFVEEYLNACKEYPDSTISISR